MKGKTNKCLDNRLLNLLKYVRDKTFDRLIKLTKGKVTTRINKIQERHLCSLTLSTGSVKAEDSNTWTVLGEDRRSSYKVSKLLDACNGQQNCQLNCQECNICVHMYVCNCPDSLIATTICKHIHLVCRYSTCQDDNYAGQWSEDGTYYSETQSTNQDEKNFAEKSAEIDFLKDCLKKASNNDRETDRERQQLERSINSAHSLFISIREHGNKHLPIPKENAPHNKNVVPQKRFFSTKKKSRKINVRLVKPSKEEKMEITGNWRGDNNQISTEKQISSDNINTEGEHVKTIELRYLSCLYVSYTSYMFS